MRGFTYRGVRDDIVAALEPVGGSVLSKVIPERATARQPLHDGTAFAFAEPSQRSLQWYSGLRLDRKKRPDDNAPPDRIVEPWHAWPSGAQAHRETTTGHETVRGSTSYWPGVSTSIPTGEVVHVLVELVKESVGPRIDVALGVQNRAVHL